MNTKSNNLFFLLLTLLIVGSASCTSDTTDIAVSTGDESTIVLSLAPFTRSVDMESTSFQEVKMDAMTALVFDAEKEGMPFLYKATIAAQTYDEANAAYQLQIDADQRDTPIQLVLLPNVYIHKSLGEYVGLPKNHLLEALEYTTLNINKTYKWIGGDEYFDGIPMYGETATFVPDRKTISIEKPIPMKRALARVDVGFNYYLNDEGEEVFSPLMDKSDTPKPFAIQNIRLYNVPEKGLVSPNLEDENKPNLCADSEVIEPVFISLEEKIEEPLIGRIYLPENKGGNFQEFNKEVTTLVVGLYNENFINEIYPDAPHVRYFRADLADGNGNIISLLRNQRILLNIDDVKDVGYNTPDEAFHMAPNLGLKLSVVDWVTTPFNLGVGGLAYRVKLDSNMAELSYMKGDEAVIPFTTNVPFHKLKLEEVDESLYDINIKVVDPIHDKYALEIKSKQENLKDALEVNKFRLFADGISLPIEAKQLKLKANIDVANVQVSEDARFIKGWNTRSSASQEGAKEFISVDLTYANETKNSEDNNIYMVTATNEELGLSFSGKLDLNGMSREGTATVKLMPEGTPVDVGNYNFDIKIEDMAAYIDKAAQIKDEVTVVSTYKKLRVLSLASKKETDRMLRDYNGSRITVAGRIIHEFNNFGKGTDDRVKVQEIEIDAKEVDKDFDFIGVNLEDYDLVVTNFTISTEGQNSKTSLLEYINAGGYFVEANQNGKNNNFMHYLFDTSMDVEYFKNNRTKSLGVYSKEKVTHPVLESIYSIYGEKLLIGDESSSSIAASMHPDALALGYRIERDEEMKDLVSMLVHRSKAYLWIGDSSIFSSEKDAVVTVDSNGTPNANGKLLVNVLNEAIKYTHDRKLPSGKDMYNW